MLSQIVGHVDSNAASVLCTLFVCLAALGIAMVIGRQAKVRVRAELTEKLARIDIERHPVRAAHIVDVGRTMYEPAAPQPDGDKA